MFLKKHKTTSINEFNQELVKLIEQQRRAYEDATRTHNAFMQCCNRSRSLLDQMKRELELAEGVHRKLQSMTKEANVA